MAVSLETIRTLTTKARTEGVDAARRELEGYAASQQKIATTGNAMRTSNDNATKSVLSARDAFDRLERKIDPVINATSRFEAEQRKVQRAINEGSISSERASNVLSLLGQRHADALERAGAGAHSAAAGVDRFNGSLDRIQAFAWNNTNLSGNDIDRVILPIKSLGGAIGALPTLAIAAGVAVEGAMALIGHSAQRALADLQSVSEKSGLGVGAISGAQIVGARAGLTQEQTRGALENAGSEFSSYSRNSGSVKSTLESVDEGFLKVADKARSAGEFIDIIGNKIRALPTAEGLDLSKALLGDDAGQKLFSSIQTGQLSMRGLADEAARAGDLNAQLAQHAEEVQHQIDEAAQIARTKLLVAFQDLNDPISSLQRGFYGVVGSIADAIRGASRFHDIIANGPLGQAAGIHASGGVPFEEAFGKYRRPGTVIGSEEYGPPMPSSTSTTAAGLSRARYAAREDTAGGSSGKSEADRAREAYEKITRELENQKALLTSTGEEHDRVALKIEVERRQLELGTGATADMKTHIADMVTELDKAKKSQDALAESAKKVNEAYSAASNSIAGAIKGIVHGDKPGDALQKALQSTQDQLLDASLTGGGPFAKILGLDGKNGAVGGLFGGLGGMLGIGSQSTGTMTVNAGVVTVNGGVGGIAGAAGGGGLIGSAVNWIGGLFGQNAEGTDSWRGGMTWVGEKGPELVNLPRGSAVMPNAQSLAYARSLASGGSNDNARGVAPAAAPVTVNLHGAPAGTQVQHSTDSSGGRRIDVIMGEVFSAGAKTTAGREALRNAGRLTKY